MKQQPNSIEYLNDLYEAILNPTPQCISQAKHLLRLYYTSIGSFDIPRSLFHHKFHSTTFLLHAIASYNLPIVQFLLEYGVDVQERHQTSYVTPVWLVCQQFHHDTSLPMLQLLLPHYSLMEYATSFKGTLLYAILSTSGEFNQFTLQMFDFLLRYYDNSFNLLGDTNESTIDVSPNTTNFTKNLWIGQIEYPYQLLPTSLQQFNSIQHESATISSQSIPKQSLLQQTVWNAQNTAQSGLNNSFLTTKYHNNTITLSLFHLMFYNPSQSNLNVYIKQLCYMLMPYYNRFLTNLAYEFTILNIFYFDQWLLHGLLSSQMCSVDAIVFVFNLDFYNPNYPKTSAKFDSNVEKQDKLEKTTIFRQKMQHPVLVNGKMPQFDYIYTYLEHVSSLQHHKSNLNLHNQDKSHSQKKNQIKAIYTDSCLIIELLLSLPTSNIHNWPWDLTPITSTADIPQSLKKNPKLTRAEFAQLSILLLYIHPRHSTINILENILRLLFKYTYCPSPADDSLPLDQILYDPHRIYKNGPFLSFLMHSNYPFSSSLLQFIGQNIMGLTLDPTRQEIYTCQPIDGVSTPPQLFEFLNQTVFFRGFFNDMLKFGLKWFNKHDNHCLEFATLIYKWFFYPFFPKHAQALQLPTKTPFSTGINTLPEALFNILINNLAMNTHITVSDSLQLTEILFSHFTTDFGPKISPNFFHIFFRLQITSARLNGAFACGYYKLVMKYALSNVTVNCPDFNKEKVKSVAMTILTENASTFFLSPQYNISELLDILFDWKKAKEDYYLALNIDADQYGVNFYKKQKEKAEKEAKIIDKKQNQFNTLTGVPQHYRNYLVNIDDPTSLSPSQSPTQQSAGITKSSPHQSTNPEENPRFASYFDVKQVLSTASREICRLTIHMKDRDDDVDLAASATDQATSQTSYSYTNNDHRQFFARNSIPFRLLTANDSSNNHHNPFVTDHMTEVYLRIVLKDLLVYYQTHPISPRIIVFFCILLSKALKPPVVAIAYIPNRPFRDYLHNFHSSTGFIDPSSAQSLSSTHILDSGPTRRRGNVVVGKLNLPTPIPSPSGHNFTRTNNIADLSVPRAYNPVNNAHMQRHSVLASHGDGIEGLLSQKVNFTELLLFLEYFHRVVSPPTVKKTPEKTENIPKIEQIPQSQPIKMPQPVQQPQSSPQLSSASSPGSMGLFKIRMVNQKPQKSLPAPSPTTVSLVIPPLSPDPSIPNFVAPPPDDDSEFSDNIESSPDSLKSISSNQSHLPIRKVLKPSSQQQRHEGPASPIQQSASPLLNNPSRILNNSDDDIIDHSKLALQLREIYSNCPFTTLTTTPTLIPPERPLTSNHIIASNYLKLRQAMFPTPVYDLPIHGTNMGGATVSDTTQLCENIKKHHALQLGSPISDDPGNNQLYSIDLLFSFLVHLFINRQYEDLLQSPIITAKSGSLTPGKLTPGSSHPKTQDSGLFRSSGGVSSGGTLVPEPLSLNPSGNGSDNTNSRVGDLANDELMFGGTPQHDLERLQVSIPSNHFLFKQLDLMNQALIQRHSSPLIRFNLTNFRNTALNNQELPGSGFNTDGHIHLDVTQMFLHEITPHTTQVLTRVIENIMKHPYLMTLVASPPDEPRVTVNSTYVPLFCIHTHTSGHLPAQNLETQPIVPFKFNINNKTSASYIHKTPMEQSFLNHLHWSQYSFGWNALDYWRPFYTHIDIIHGGRISPPILSHHTSDSGSAAPTDLFSSSGGESLLNSPSSTPNLIMQPLQLNSSSSSSSIAQHKASGKPISFRPPFAALLWLGRPNMYVSYNTRFPHSFSPHSDPTYTHALSNGVFHAHMVGKSQQNEGFPQDIFLNNMKPGFSINLDSEYINVFKLLMDYWVTTAYQRYHLIYSHASQGAGNMVNSNNEDFLTIQQELLQTLYTPYINNINDHIYSQGGVNRVEEFISSNTQLPPIFSTIPIFYLLLSRFTPHNISPHLIEVFNIILSQLLSTDAPHRLNLHTLSANGLPIDLNPYSPQLTGGHNLYQSTNSQTDQGSLTQSQGSTLATSQASSSPQQQHPRDKKSLLSRLFNKNSSNYNNNIDDIIIPSGGNDHVVFDDVILTPLNVISTTLHHRPQIHTTPLISPTHNIPAITAGGAKSSGTSANLIEITEYLNVLETVLFIEQQHHYTLFYTQQCTNTHVNNITTPYHSFFNPTATQKANTVHKYAALRNAHNTAHLAPAHHSFNTFRLVNLFNFEFYTLLHMFLLPLQHPLRSAISLQTQVALELPAFQITPTDSAGTALKTGPYDITSHILSSSKHLYVPSNSHWVISNLFSQQLVQHQPSGAGDPSPKQIVSACDMRNTIASIQRVNRPITLPLSSFVVPTTTDIVSSTTTISTADSSSTTAAQRYHAQFHFSSHLYTLLSMFTAFGFDWNTEILQSLPNHFTASNISQFSTDLSEHTGILTQNIMKNFANQKQALSSTYSVILQTYLPPIFILFSYYNINSLFVAFLSTLCCNQRYIAHSSLYTNGYNVAKVNNILQQLTKSSPGRPSTTTSMGGLPSSTSNMYDLVSSSSTIGQAGGGLSTMLGYSTSFSTHAKFSTELSGKDTGAGGGRVNTKKPSIYPIVYLHPADIQYSQIHLVHGNTYDKDGLKMNKSNTNNPNTPLLSTLFTQTIDGNVMNTDPSMLQVSPSTYATNFTTLIQLDINQYIPLTSIPHINLLSLSSYSAPYCATSGQANGVLTESDPFYKKIKNLTFLAILFLRTDVVWDTNWYNLLTLLIQNGAYLDYDVLFKHESQYIANNVSVSTMHTASNTSKLSLNYILLHFITGHNSKQRRSFIWYKALLLLLSSGHNTLYHRTTYNNALAASTIVSTTASKSHDLFSDYPPMVLKIKDTFFASGFSNDDLISNGSGGSSAPSQYASNDTSTDADGLQQHNIKYFPSYQEMWLMLDFYHRQGTLQFNHKYVNIATALLFHPRIEMRKYWFEPFKLYYDCILQYYFQHTQYKHFILSNKNGQPQKSFFRKAFGGDTSIPFEGSNTTIHQFSDDLDLNGQRPTPSPFYFDESLTQAFIPIQHDLIFILHTIHHTLFAYDLSYTFTPRSLATSSQQIMILNYFASLPFEIFLALHSFVRKLLFNFFTLYSNKPVTYMLNNGCNTGTGFTLLSSTSTSGGSLGGSPNLGLHYPMDAAQAKQFTYQFSDNLDNIYNLLYNPKKSLMVLNALPNLVPIASSAPGLPRHINATPFQYDNIDGTSIFKSDSNNSIIQLKTIDLPVHPTTHYSTLSPTLSTRSTPSSSNQPQIKAISMNSTSNQAKLCNIFTHPEDDHLSSSIYQAFVFDGTDGLLWYIMNNCYPHSQYLPSSYVIHQHTKHIAHTAAHILTAETVIDAQQQLGVSSENQNVSSRGSLFQNSGSQSTQSLRKVGVKVEVPIHVGGVELSTQPQFIIPTAPKQNAFPSSVTTMPSSSPSDISYIQHDFNVLLDHLKSVHQAPPTSPAQAIFNTTTAGKFSTSASTPQRSILTPVFAQDSSRYLNFSSPLNQSLLQHALLRRWPEQLLYTITAALGGLEVIIEHTDFNGYSIFDYLSLCHTHCYAPNFVLYVFEHYSQYGGNIGGGYDSDHYQSQQLGNTPNVTQKNTNRPSSGAIVGGNNTDQYRQDLFAQAMLQPHSSCLSTTQSIPEHGDDDAPPPPPPMF